jgi:hypothetical protein
MKKNLVVGKQKNGAATIHRVQFGRMPVNQMIHLITKLCQELFSESPFY